MKKVVKHFTFIAMLGLFTTLQSCGENPYFDQAYSFEDVSWDKKDTAVFKVDVQDSLMVHDFILTLRTTKEYLYSNLWVYISVTAPDGTTSKVAQKIPLAAPDGSWLGKTSGALVESRLRFDSKPFPIKGEYVFKIMNATQDESISNVMDIGLRIE
ncbi:gliding motility lipoprotein GldH [Brumimicrobium mesophilum]|uniref:gliding motility lipoprotein GldH n=1 Tax=Brumimicrobium mesophilum TaxID=392717 RepID=UPI00131CACD3|nr:gliding motility lipoprotein GldH [Brumimicrobium mesophilum]